jgi:transposase
LRTTPIQLAWLWLRHQPQSALALWFKERVTRNGGRFKKTTIVALARKLLRALWKYVTAGSGTAFGGIGRTLHGGVALRYLF